MTTGTTNGDAGEQYYHSLGITAALDGGSARPYAAFILPLDESIREDMDFFLMAGLEIPIATR